ncbi:MAG: type II secretion system protein [Firmicutes bacterium]|nr:type II secretion system protein [Bacillota bacterium]
MRNNKGFTLIELLAVIVVLAIVMVLAATTVLPYMANARKQAFATEAETVKKAASQAVSLIGIGSIAEKTGETENYKKVTVKEGEVTKTGYCFTIAQLKSLGLFEKDDTSYEGTVTALKEGNSYKYTVHMKNSNYYILQASSGNITTADVKDGTPGQDAGFKSSC